MTIRRPSWHQIGAIALLLLVVLVVVACAAPVEPGASGVSGAPHVSPTPQPPLQPAQPGADPISLLAWLFTPIFQTMFIVLVAAYDAFTAIGLPAAIGWAIGWAAGDTELCRSRRLAIAQRCVSDGPS